MFWVKNFVFWIRVKCFLVLNTHLLRLAFGFFFLYYRFFYFFLFFFGMARWLTLCPNSVYWMDQSFNILGELLSQLGKGAMVTLDPLAH